MTVSNNVHYDYKLNNLNQLVQKTYSSNDKEGTLYTYDGRGNLVSNDKYTRTTSGMAWQNEETYVYDETNHMVDGKNEKGERSLYTYNGLGLRVGRELIMKDNTHGYTDFHDETPSVETGLNKPEVAVESYVIDYTSPTFRTLTMEEEGGFDYRWVYGLDKLSVKITSEGTNWWGQNVKQDILKDYLHQDRLGNTTNLTDKFGRVVGRADYNEWGEITYKDALDITSAYRRIYPQLNYTGHDWDDVLEMYYAKARFYDPDAKRFVEIDPVKGQVTDPLSLVSYLYCVDNPLRWVDPLGLRPVKDDPRESFTTKTNLPKPPRPAADVQRQTNNESKHQQNQGSKANDTTQWATVTGNGVRFRSDYNLDSNNILFTLNADTEVEYLGHGPHKDGHEWARVKYNGKVGWMASEYLLPQFADDHSENDEKQLTFYEYYEAHSNPTIQEQAIGGTYQNIAPFSSADNPSWIILFGKESHTQGDSGLRGLSDQEIHDGARDHNLPKEERERYKREEKIRGNRNKRKRQDRHHHKIEEYVPQPDTGLISGPTVVPYDGRDTVETPSVYEPNRWLPDMPSIDMSPSLVAGAFTVIVGGIIFLYTGDPTVFQNAFSY